MNKFLQQINLNEKLTPENHIALFYYSRLFQKNLMYNDLTITEKLINNFMEFLKDDRKKTNFINYLSSKEESISNFLQSFKEKPWEFAKPVIWGDRKRPKYFIDKLTLSHRFELYIEHLIKEKGNIDIGLYYGKEEQYKQGESRAGLEIKRDIKSRETNNLYIEYAERLNTDGKWVKSGIFKKDNTKYFLIGDFDEYFILRKNDLLDIYEKIAKNKYRPFNGIRLVKARRGTSLGFIIPIKSAKKISMSLDELIKELGKTA